MNINSAFKSNYLKAADFTEDTTYTIKNCAMETLGQGKDADDKPVLYFNEVDKGLALNKTNSTTIAKQYGTDTDTWVGKPVTLYPTEVEFKGEMVESIRIRARAGRIAPPQKPPTPAPQSSSPAASPAMAATAAVRAFASVTPSLTPVQRKANYDAALAERFPDTAKADMTEADWESFKADIVGSYDESTASFLSY